MALAPNRPERHLALGSYYQSVLGNFAEALEQYAQGQRLAPANTDLLVAAALAEESVSRWEAALDHLRQAERLDPRSVSTARRLGSTLVWLRRYPEALQAYDHGLAFAPGNLGLLEGKAMASLAQGDLAGARVVLRMAPKEVEPTGLAAFVANFWDLMWVLDDAQQAVLLRLTPSAFDGDRGTWGSVLAQTCALRGTRPRIRAHADSAR